MLITRNENYSSRKGDTVLIKVSPWKGTLRFGKKGKFNPRHSAPFESLKLVGAIAY